jgi:hypothetical protein
MEKGYIKVYRSCRSNPLWKDKPFSKWQAFEYLLMAAAYEPVDVLIKGQIIHLERTQLIRAKHTLANDWGWSVKKVIGFMKLLDNQKMAISKGTPQGTLITIENYNIYQGEGQAEDTQEGTAEGKQRASRGQQRRNKEVKEVKEVKELYSDLPIELIEPFEDYIKMRKTIKAPMTDRSVVTILKKLNELSNGNTKKSVEIIEQATVNCWKSFYPLREDKKKSNRQSLTELIESGAFDE